jgi:hypothetical protein
MDKTHAQIQLELLSLQQVSNMTVGKGQSVMLKETAQKVRMLQDIHLNLTIKANTTQSAVHSCTRFSVFCHLK